MFVVTGGMHDAPGLRFFGEQRCGEPSASGTVELPAQEEGPAVSRQMVLRDGARLLQTDVKLGHWRLMGARLSVRLPANLQPGTPYSLSLSTKVENAVSGCVGAPRCTASLVHEERRVLSVR